MRKHTRIPLTARERNGMIALAAIVFAIMAMGMAVSLCSRTDDVPEGRIVVCDTIRVSDSERGEKSIKQKKRGKRKNRKTGSGKEKTSPAPPVHRRHLDENLTGED